MKNNMSKQVKLLMIISGVLSGIGLIILMIISLNYWKLDLIWHLLMCFSVVAVWIIINIIGIKIILKKNKLKV